MSTPNTTPAIHEALGYDDEDLAYERRYLGRRESAQPTRVLRDDTSRQAFKNLLVEDAQRMPAPRYVFGGTK